MKWWFCDYDGTINLDHNDILDKKDYDFIHQWIKSGNKFVIATGRTYTEVKPLMDENNFDMDYAICNNGAMVYNKKGDLIVNCTISNEDREHIVKLFEEFKDKYVLSYSIANLRYDFSYTYVQDVEECEFLEPYLSRENHIEQGIKDILNNSELNLCYVMLPSWEALQVAEYINSKLKTCKAVTTHKNVIEIMNKKVSKAYGIEHIQKLEGFSIDNVITSGDGRNDIEMLEFTKNSFAMKNCQVGVKEAAQYQINHVYEIEKYLK